MKIEGYFKIIHQDTDYPRSFLLGKKFTIYQKIIFNMSFV